MPIHIEGQAFKS